MSRQQTWVRSPFRASRFCLYSESLHKKFGNFVRRPHCALGDSTLGEMNLDHHFFQVSKLSEEQNKRSSPKMEHFFPPNSGEDQKKGLHQKWNQARCQKYANGWGQIRNGGGGGGAKRAEPPALENFAFFGKNSLILELF